MNVQATEQILEYVDASYRLIGLEIDARQTDHEKTLENIARYEDILNNYDSMAGVIMEVLDSFINKDFGRKRRTVLWRMTEDSCF